MPRPLRAPRAPRARPARLPPRPPPARKATPLTPPNLGPGGSGLGLGRLHPRSERGAGAASRDPPPPARGFGRGFPPPPPPRPGGRSAPRGRCTCGINFQPLPGSAEAGPPRRALSPCNLAKLPRAARGVGVPSGKGLMRGGPRGLHGARAPPTYTQPWETQRAAPPRARWSGGNGREGQGARPAPPSPTAPGRVLPAELRRACPRAAPPGPGPRSLRARPLPSFLGARPAQPREAMGKLQPLASVGGGHLGNSACSHVAGKVPPPPRRRCPPPSPILKHAHPAVRERAGQCQARVRRQPRREP